MKYRMLTNEELSHLEDDLIAFLIVNGIDGDTWANINRDSPEKALALVALFSDQVLEKVYTNINYLELSDARSFRIFHIQEDKGELIVLERKEGSLAQLDTPEHIVDALNHQLDELTVYTSKKVLTNKALEVHQLLEQGALISDANIWNLLAKIVR